MRRSEVLHFVAADLDAMVAVAELRGWALCGGLALAVWGAPRATMDIDVLVDLAEGRPASRLAGALVTRGWVKVEHARHPGDPVPELLRMTREGVPVDLLVAHRSWEAGMVADASIVSWEGIGLPTVRAEALAAMKLRAGGPQDLVDAGRLGTLPGIDRERLDYWKRKLRVR